jgi:hypothetical protein
MEDDKDRQQGAQSEGEEEPPPYDPDPRLIGYLERAPRLPKDKAPRDGK